MVRPRSNPRSNLELILINCPGKLNDTLILARLLPRNLCILYGADKLTFQAMEILDVTIIFKLLRFSRTQKRVIELIDSDLWKSDAGPDKGSVRYRSVNAEPNPAPDTFVSVVEKCLGQDFG